MAGSTVYTDGLKTFAGLQEAGFEHVTRTQPLRIGLRKGAKSVLPLADRAIGNLQQWLIGTYHGVSRDQLQVTLMNSSFATIDAGSPWRHSKPCSASGPDVSPRHIRKYGAARTSQGRPTKAELLYIGVC
jgi:transposase-like protein